jgi:hypothetical protein
MKMEREPLAAPMKHVPEADRWVMAVGQRATIRPVASCSWKPRHHGLASTSTHRTDPVSIAASARLASSGSPGSYARPLALHPPPQ